MNAAFEQLLRPRLVLAVCDIWKHDDGYTDAECESGLEEFRQIRAGGVD